MIPFSDHKFVLLSDHKRGIRYIRKKGPLFINIRGVSRDDDENGVGAD